MKYLLTLIHIMLIVACTAQDCAIPAAVLVSASDAETFLLNGKTVSTVFPLSFCAGDEVKVSKGELTLLNSSGNIVKKSAGETYTVEGNEAENKEELLAFTDSGAKGYLSQSNAAYNVRGVNRVKPNSSNLDDAGVAAFYIRKEAALTMKLEIFEKESNTLIYTKEAITDSLLFLNECTLKPSTEYRWMLSAGDVIIPETGEFRTLDVFKEAVCDTEQEFLLEYRRTMQEGLYLQALGILYRAVRQYPETQLFHYLFGITVN